MGRLEIDRRTPVPLYHQITLALHDAITSAHLPPGSTLPPESALAHQLRVCRPTIHRAMLTLLAHGVIQRLEVTNQGNLPTFIWQVTSR